MAVPELRPRGRVVSALDRLPEAAHDRAMSSANPNRWARGYLAGRQALGQGHDTDAYLRRLTRPEDAPRIAGYLTGLAAAHANTAWGRKEMDRFAERQERRGPKPFYLRAAA